MSPTHKVSSSYAPSSGDEMALNVDDLIEVLQQFDDGWCNAFNETTSQTGLVPYNFLTTLNLPVQLVMNSPALRFNSPGLLEFVKPDCKELASILEKYASIQTSKRERCGKIEHMGHLKILGISYRSRVISVLVVGDSGIGKTSLIEHLSELPFISKRILDPEVGEAQGNIVKHYLSTVLESSNVQQYLPTDEYNLKFYDTTGFGANVDATKTIDPIIDYLKFQFAETNKLLNPTFEDEARTINLISASDAHTHIDVVIYGIFHRIKPIDKEYMRMLSPYVPIIPIVVKSDSLDPAQAFKLKESILRELEASKIEVFSFGLNLSECIAMAQTEQAGAIPFAVSNVDIEDSKRLNEMEDFQDKLFLLYSQELRRASAKKFAIWRHEMADLPQNPFGNLGNYKVADAMHDRRPSDTASINPAYNINSERKASAATFNTLSSFDRNAPNHIVSDRKGSAVSAASTNRDDDNGLFALKISGASPKSILKPHVTPLDNISDILGSSKANDNRQSYFGGGKPHIGARMSSHPSIKQKPMDIIVEDVNGYQFVINNENQAARHTEASIGKGNHAFLRLKNFMKRG